MASESGCFANLTEDLQKIIDNKDSKQTKAVIEKSVGIFRSYCESKEYVFSEVGKYNDFELSSLLRKFYAEIRTKSGDYYAIIIITTGWQVSLTIVSYIFWISQLVSIKYSGGIVKQIQHGLFQEVVKIPCPSVLDAWEYFPPLHVRK